MNKKAVYISIFIALLLIFSITMSYAYFSGGVIGNEETQDTIVEAGTLSLVYKDGPEIKIDNAYPGDKIEKIFTVENTGTLDTQYTIYLKNLINNFINDELMLSISCTSYKDGEIYGACENIENQIITYSTSSSNHTLKENIQIAAKVLHEYKLTILFKETNSAQNYNQGKKFSGLINILEEKEEYKCAINIYDIGTLAHKILSDNCAYADNESSPYVISETGINFGAISSDTNGRGLYYTTDLARTEDIDGDGTGEKVYYYRGDVENNYVVFANFCWRIVRINEDKSIRLRYDGVATVSGDTYTCIQTGQAVNIGTSYYNSNYNAAKYLGYMYDTNTSSTVKSKVDSWYKTNIYDKDINLHNLVADTIYCNDRKSMGTENGSDGHTITKYGFGKRRSTIPQYLCPQKSDKFTVNNKLGNSLLTYPIALLTGDEMFYAGSRYGSNLKNYFLYTNQSYWLMTPDHYNASATVACPGYLSNIGGFRFVGSDGNTQLGTRTTLAVVPVLSLVPESTVSQGTGIYNNPYIIG